MYLPECLKLLFYLLIICIFHIQKDKSCRPVMDRHSFFCFILLNRISGDPVIFLPVVLNLFKIFIRKYNQIFFTSLPERPCQDIRLFPLYGTFRIDSLPVKKAIGFYRLSNVQVRLFSRIQVIQRMSLRALILLVNNIDFLSVSRKIHVLTFLSKCFIQFFIRRLRDTYMLSLRHDHSSGIIQLFRIIHIRHAYHRILLEFHVIFFLQLFPECLILFRCHTYKIIREQYFRLLCNLR